MKYLKLSDVMATFDEWGCSPAEGMKLFRKFMQAVFEKRLTVEGYEGKPPGNDQGGRKSVPKDLFESGAILDWGRTPEQESYDILVDRESIHLHLSNDEFGDYFDRANKPIWSGMQIEADSAAPLLAELRAPLLPASLTLAEACCWIATRDSMKVSVTDGTCGSLERNCADRTLRDAAAACRNAKISVTGKLFSKRERIDPIAFDDNGFRLDGGGCLAPNGASDDLLASLLVMEHSGRVVIGGDAWRTRQVWLDVRFARNELMRLWPPHPVVRTDAEPATEQHRLTDDDVKSFILAKAQECGGRPGIRSWSEWPEMRQSGVTKPRFESLWREIYPNPKRGRPSKNSQEQ